VLQQQQNGAAMAKDVHTARQAILQDRLGLREAQAAQELAAITKAGRYVRDIWSIAMLPQRQLWAVHAFGPRVNCSRCVLRRLGRCLWHWLQKPFLAYKRMNRVGQGS
jgi:hypothetical protein